ALVRTCLDAIDNRISDPREQWLRVLFAVADAERLGCADARELALEWSKRGAKFTSEHHFDVVWESYKPGGGITVGTLISMAGKAGADLSPWRDAALALSHAAEAPDQASNVVQLQTKPVLPPRALGVGALPQTPRKRQWLHGTALARGVVAFLV